MHCIEEKKLVKLVFNRLIVALLFVIILYEKPKSKSLLIDQISNLKQKQSASIGAWK